MMQAVRDPEAQPVGSPAFDNPGDFEYYNAGNLDEFYVAAHGGWDFESGEVVDHERDMATARDYNAYNRAPWHAANVNAVAR